MLNITRNSLKPWSLKRGSTVVTSKSFDHLLNNSPTNCVYTETFYSEFSYIGVWFTEQNLIHKGIVYELNFTLVINDVGI